MPPARVCCCLVAAQPPTRSAGALSLTHCIRCDPVRCQHAYVCILKDINKLNNVGSCVGGVRAQ